MNWQKLLFLTAIFSVGGGISYVNAVLGLRVPTGLIGWLLTTPFAIFSVALGSCGLLMAYQHPTRKKLIVSCILVVSALAYMEVLLWLVL